MSVAVITGGSSGLGRAIMRAMPDTWFYNLSVHNPDGGELDNEQWIHADVSDPEDVDTARDLMSRLAEVNIVINCAGVNYLEEFPRITLSMFHRVMAINTSSIMVVTQSFFVPLVSNGGTVLNIVSNASHMPMTHSLAYNASKGAAYIMTLQMARELTRQYGITVFGVSPSKLADTRMSEYIERRVPELRGWTEEEAKEYQLKALLAGEEIPSARVAEFIAFLLSKKDNHRFLAGCVIPYGA